MRCTKAVSMHQLGSDSFVASRLLVFKVCAVEPACLVAVMPVTDVLGRWAMLPFGMLGRAPTSQRARYAYLAALKAKRRKRVVPTNCRGRGPGRSTLGLFPPEQSRRVERQTDTYLPESSEAVVLDRETARAVTRFLDLPAKRVPADRHLALPRLILTGTAR